MVTRRAEILIERMREHAVRHHRVAVIRSRSGPNHVGVIGPVIIAVAGGRFRFVYPGASVHTAVDAPDRFVSRPARHVEIDRDIDAMILHALEPADRLAEDDTSARILAS